MIIFGENLIQSASNLQNSISPSSTEAEYVALSDRIETISQLREFLIELCVTKICNNLQRKIWYYRMGN